MKEKKLRNDNPNILDGLKNTCETMKTVLWESEDVEDPNKVLNDCNEDPEVKKQLKMSLARIERMEKKLEESDNKKKAKKKKDLVEQEKIDHEAARKVMEESVLEQEEQEEQNEQEIDK